MPKNARKTQAVRFCGGNAYYITGVPARDLSLDELEALPEAIQKKCLETGLYVIEDVETQESET